MKIKMLESQCGYVWQEIGYLGLLVNNISTHYEQMLFLNPIGRFTFTYLISRDVMDRLRSFNYE